MPRSNIKNDVNDVVVIMKLSRGFLRDKTSTAGVLIES